MSLDDIMAVPLIRCDQVQWTLFGISLAGFNAIFSLGGAAAIALLARRNAA
jgi:histidinol dehydrogenase